MRGGGFTATATMPATWNVSRDASNPVIDVADNPNETVEQYVPGPFRIGDRTWVTVKGSYDFYVWRSSAGGVPPYELMNGGLPIVSHGGAGYKSLSAIEPAAKYDLSTDTVHYYWKGRTTGDVWSCAHGTAPGSDPTDVTEDAGNPFLTSATIATALGGGTVNDVVVSDVVVGPDGTYHFFGYVLHNSVYKLWHGTGSDWTTVGSITSLLSAPGGAVTVVQCPSVFRMPPMIGTPLYGMWYSLGGGQPNPRSIRLGTSSNLTTWSFSDTTDYMSPTTGWEDDEVYASSLLRSPISPYLAPLLNADGKWELFYSGLGGGVASSGIFYLDPR